jgi:hypothetical protein
MLCYLIFEHLLNRVRATSCWPSTKIRTFMALTTLWQPQHGTTTTHPHFLKVALKSLIGSFILWVACVAVFFMNIFQGFPSVFACLQDVVRTWIAPRSSAILLVGHILKCLVAGTIRRLEGLLAGACTSVRLRWGFGRACGTYLCTSLYQLFRTAQTSILQYLLPRTHVNELRECVCQVDRDSIDERGLAPHMTEPQRLRGARLKRMRKCYRCEGQPQPWRSRSWRYTAMSTYKKTHKLQIPSFAKCCFDIFSHKARSYAMSHTSILIHTLNALIGCLCIVVIGLTAHGITLKDELERTIPFSVKDTGMSFLFWPGCGGLVDMLLFILLWNLTPWEQGSVCSSLHSGI